MECIKASNYMAQIPGTQLIFFARAAMPFIEQTVHDFHLFCIKFYLCSCDYECYNRGLPRYFRANALSLDLLRYLTTEICFLFHLQYSHNFLYSPQNLFSQPRCYSIDLFQHLLRLIYLEIPPGQNENENKWTK